MTPPRWSPSHRIYCILRERSRAVRRMWQGTVTRNVGRWCVVRPRLAYGQAYSESVFLIEEKK
jgi:hypothetical protein